MDARLNALRARHGILQVRIDREQSRPAPDSIRLAILKKLKLRIREEINAVELAIAKARSGFKRQPA